jgi:hypothetical protein
MAVKGTMIAEAGSSFRIEAFSNDVCGPGVDGQGKSFLGTSTIVVGDAGFAVFEVPVAFPLAAGRFITATATPTVAGHATTQFSPCLPVSPPVPLAINRETGAVRLSWPASAVDYLLHVSDNLGAGQWQPSTSTPTTSGGFFHVTEPLSRSRFFQLHKNRAPINDMLARAIPLTGITGTAMATNRRATKETGEPSHAGDAGGSSIWYRWAPEIPGNVTIKTLGSDFDTLLAVYTGGSIAGLTPKAVNDNAPGGETSEVSFDASDSDTYVIAIDGAGGAQGNVRLEWRLEAPPPPANDNFANAAVISGPSGMLTADNRLATIENSEPFHDGNQGRHSVWFVWTAPGAASITLTTEGSTFDTVLAIYTGSAINALTLVDSDDDSGPDATSALTITPVPGTTYYIAVDGYDEEENGTVVFNWNQ